ncbi:NMD3 domain-containing protein [Rozella allomycis CSF55]|uniref:60S ribosomal export protein NMD3 n=1 Tax=Rozella allomycis (strain CSF55) TaxID=988480 RepID=A0A075ARN1_ROZAC|nr:NMD3 domain-containing protein [Rozella allomycis CSF55]|eukprot:EPZ32835.1 NMD3 domain-containing protein [Rozella allomycis CSF55]
MACLRSRVDITEGIPKQLTLGYCKSCERFHQPPNSWVHCALESKELLALCLKKLKGLNKVRLVDAGFIWTEPHSRRIKIKIQVQKEVFANTVLQQTLIIEYIMAGQQCEDCARIEAKNTWKAALQLRQKVNHKKTFLFLEQLILKYNAHKDTTNISEKRDGLDFFFQSKNHALRLLEFLQGIAPLRYKASEQLVSSDIHEGTANMKYTFSVELVPVCKDDLVLLPLKVANALGGIRPLVLCSRVSNLISFVDPNTLQTADLNALAYWRTPFTSLCSYKDLIEYYVVDIEPHYGVTKGKFMLADVYVCKVNDMNTTYIARSHLGSVLKAGDLVYGYDLATANFNSETYDQMRTSYDFPDVVIVKKSYSDKRKKNKQRTWKLKALNKTSDEDLAPKKSEQMKIEMDYENFLRDIEEDEEMRAAVALYKDHEAIQRKLNSMETESSNEGELEIPLEQLLDELDLNDADVAGN